MSKRTIRLAPLALAALAALSLASAAPARGTATIKISHHVRGCHVWSLNSGPARATLAAVVTAGTTLKFVNDDVMPHKLIQTAGPKLHLLRPVMNKMGATITVKLTHKGVYRFTTKPGEDYRWASSIKTVGDDYVLHLTVRVK